MEFEEEKQSTKRDVATWICVAVLIISISWSISFVVSSFLISGTKDSDRFAIEKISGKISIVNDGYTGHSYLFLEGTGGVWLRPTKKEIYK